MSEGDASDETIVERYIELGLGMGRHVGGLVDAYYGPPELAARVNAGPLPDPRGFAIDARRLLADLDGGAMSDPRRRKWLVAQVRGLLTTARKLAGEEVGYAEEVEQCYGVAPRRVPEDDLEDAHRAIDAVLPGSGSLMERRTRWIEAQAVPPDKLGDALASLAEDLRERTLATFGLPEGERVDFELVTGKPWSGFNYYLGGLRSRVAVNTDLPVLSTGLAHLVAHESYPGHHTEHCHKEIGLVRSRHLLEETIFLVGTPQCLISEGLADLGLEILVDRHPEDWVAGHLRPLGIDYPADAVRKFSDAGETLGGVRANAAFRLHEDGADPETVVDEVSRWALIPRERAAQVVQFLNDQTWRTYITCYVEGLPLCRRFAGGNPTLFARLLNEQLTPADLH